MSLILSFGVFGVTWLCNELVNQPRYTLPMPKSCWDRLQQSLDPKRDIVGMDEWMDGRTDGWMDG